MAEKKTPKSKFAGFTWADPERNERDSKSGQRGAKNAFEMNKEDMRSDYEKYKDKSDPSADEMAKRLGEGDEAAYDTMRKAHKKADKVNAMGPVRRKVYDVTGFKRGGKVSSASSRADGIAQRGKTRGKLV